MTNRMPKIGRLVLTPMLNEFGKLIGDFTIAKAGPERFLIFGSSAAQKYHMRWFEQHLPQDGSVTLHRYDQTLVGLSIAGPKAQAVLAKLVDEDVSTAAFRFMDFREMAVGGAPAMVNRISYTGDLGYEIWMAPAYQRLVYQAIKAAGEEFGIVDFGMRALLSMRLEKNFPTWFRELRPIYGPYRRIAGSFRADGEERFHRPRSGSARTGRGSEIAARVVRRRCRRCRRDGRRTGMGQGGSGFRQRRATAWLRRAALRRDRQGTGEIPEQRCRHDPWHRRRSTGGWSAG